jgi:hypothetical protein
MKLVQRINARPSNVVPEASMFVWQKLVVDLVANHEPCDRRILWIFYEEGKPLIVVLCTCAKGQALGVQTVTQWHESCVLVGGSGKSMLTKFLKLNYEAYVTGNSSMRFAAESNCGCLLCHDYG